MKLTCFTIAFGALISPGFAVENSKKAAITAILLDEAAASDVYSSDTASGGNAIDDATTRGLKTLAKDDPPECGLCCTDDYRCLVDPDNDFVPKHDKPSHEDPGDDDFFPKRDEKPTYFCWWLKKC